LHGTIGRGRVELVTLRSRQGHAIGYTTRHSSDLYRLIIRPKRCYTAATAAAADDDDDNKRKKRRKKCTLKQKKQKRQK